MSYFSTAWGEFIADDVGGGIYTYVHSNTTGEDTYAALWSKAIIDSVFRDIRMTRKISL
jgi:hypothetical protein